MPRKRRRLTGTSSETSSGRESPSSRQNCAASATDLSSKSTNLCSACKIAFGGRHIYIHTLIFGSVPKALNPKPGTAPCLALRKCALGRHSWRRSLSSSLPCSERRMPGRFRATSGSLGPLVISESCRRAGGGGSGRHAAGDYMAGADSGIQGQTPHL